jgi:hypothetical protein
MRGMAVLCVVVVGGLAACSGEKMTPERCLQTVHRMEQRTEQCMAPPPNGTPAGAADAPSDLDDVMLEMCKHDQMQAMATSTLPCLEMSDCKAYLACLRQPSLGDAVKKLLPSRL